jgi:hypothetical protein
MNASGRLQTPFPTTISDSMTRAFQYSHDRRYFRVFRVFRGSKKSNFNPKNPSQPKPVQPGPTCILQFFGPCPSSASHLTPASAPQVRTRPNGHERLWMRTVGCGRVQSVSHPPGIEHHPPPLPQDSTLTSQSSFITSRREPSIEHSV